VNHIASGTATVRRPWRPGKDQADAFALLPLASDRRAGDLHRVTYLQTDGFPHTAGSTVTSLTIQQASLWGSRRRPEPVTCGDQRFTLQP
jgi:hypothetical protein